MTQNPFRESATVGPVPLTGRSNGNAPFSRRHRLSRALWNLCWLLLFRPSPRPCHGWRAFLLRMFGARLGQHCHIYPGARIWAPWNLICQDHACIADHAIIYNQAIIFLGEHAVVSQGAHLCTGTHDYQSPQFDLVTHPITIEQNAWLGAECFLLPGVTIGAGAVVGARSLVTKNMPAGMVCGGHPCKPIKPRWPDVADHALSA